MKWVYIIIGLVGVLLLINSYVPSAWATGFNLPLPENHHFHISWAICILAAFLGIGAWKLKSA